MKNLIVSITRGADKIFRVKTETDEKYLTNVFEKTPWNIFFTHDKLDYWAPAGSSRDTIKALIKYPDIYTVRITDMSKR